MRLLKTLVVSQTADKVAIVTGAAQGIGKAIIAYALNTVLARRQYLDFISNCCFFGQHNYFHWLGGVLVPDYSKVAIKCWAKLIPNAQNNAREGGDY